MPLEGGGPSHGEFGGKDTGVGSPGTGRAGSKPGDFGHEARMGNTVGAVQGTFKGTIGEGRNYTYSPGNKPIPSALDQEALNKAAWGGAVKGSGFGIGGALVGGLIGYLGNQTNQLKEFGLGGLVGQAGTPTPGGEPGEKDGEHPIDPNVNLAKLLAGDQSSMGGSGNPTGIVSDLLSSLPSALGGPTTDSGRGFLDMLIMALSKDSEAKNFNF